ncbi:MAG TPA: RibD family protein [bacterium]|nr:RibD family protein [bacterium]
MKPRVIIHNAVSLDGRIDWFEPDIVLYYDMTSHWKEDATLAGVDTLLAVPEDMEQEDLPDSFSPKINQEDTRPFLVVPDSRGRMTNWDYWQQLSYWKTSIVLCSRRTPNRYLKQLESHHIRYLVAGKDHVDFYEALHRLNTEFGITTIRVDSGGTLNGVLLRAGLVDEISLLIHPTLVGGVTPRSFFRAPDLESKQPVINVRLSHLEEVRDDLLWVIYEVVKE